MPNTIKLIDGCAELMGDGVAVIVQKDDNGVMQNTVVQLPDLKALLEAMEG